MKAIPLISIILGLCSLTGYAQPKAVTAIHAQVHRQQLANAKSRLDQGVIQELVKQDVIRREIESNAVKTVSEETAQLVRDLLKEAKSHIGKRYRSGAKGPSAFDCSGFSGYVFHQFGYDLSSSSSAQYSDGSAVEKNDLRPGDLVFFKGRNRNGSIGHVGIVVTADNERGTFQFIHASTSKGIRIDCNDGYYSSRFIGARRIVEE